MRVDALLGFARRAGALSVGNQAAREALQKGKVHLFLVSLDASPRTGRKIEEIAGDTPIIHYGKKEELSEKLGWSGEVAVLAVTDEQIARSILMLARKEKDWGNDRCR